MGVPIRTRLTPGHSAIIALAGLGLLLVIAPICGLIWRVVREGAWQRAPESEVISAISLSLITTAIALLVILIIGTPLAWTLARWQFRGRRLLNTVIELPIVLPPAVAGLALLVTFGQRGLFGPALDAVGINLAFSTEAVVIAQTFVALPFYTRAAQVGFAAVDRDIEEAAMVDGANRELTFMYVTLPLASRALMSGALLSWARALGEFGATIIFAGSLAGETRTMPLLVYNVLERDLNAAVWTALILVGLAAVAIGLTRLLANDEASEG
jgi:molybdate transport system permease protein